MTTEKDPSQKFIRVAWREHHEMVVPAASDEEVNEIWENHCWNAVSGYPDNTFCSVTDFQTSLPQDNAENLETARNEPPLDLESSYVEVHIRLKAKKFDNGVKESARVLEKRLEEGDLWPEAEGLTSTIIVRYAEP